MTVDRGPSFDTARRAADDVLLDETLIRVDHADYERFVTLLDRPPEAEKFGRLMSAARPWTPCRSPR